MTDFNNDFTWSFSRDRTFKACKRKYYFNYYGSWGGWDPAAEESAKQIYRLKKMTTIPMMIGDIIHDIAESTFEKLRRKKATSLKDTELLVVKEFKRRWQESKNKDWENNPTKATNLFELYYDDRPSDSRLLEYRSIMADCVQGFFESESYQFIQGLAPIEWLTIENLDHFNFADTKIWIKLDFAARHKEKIYIYDWKTGQVAKEDENQLAVYALYAMEKWQIPLNDLRLFDIYLRKQLPVKMKITEKIIENAKKEIKISIKEMKTLLDDEKTNLATIENFPMVENTNECKRCFYKEVCFSETWASL